MSLAICLAAPAVAQQGTAASTVVAVRAGKILDVRTRNYLTDQMIWIEGDRITAVGKSSDIQKQLPSSAKIIDLSNATVLP
jgi:imidazolonepropionase-like amidohydrolase